MEKNMFNTHMPNWIPLLYMKQTQHCKSTVLHSLKNKADSAVDEGKWRWLYFEGNGLTGVTGRWGWYAGLQWDKTDVARINMQVWVSQSESTGMPQRLRKEHRRAITSWVLQDGVERSSRIVEGLQAQPLKSIECWTRVCLRRLNAATWVEAYNMMVTGGTRATTGPEVVYSIECVTQ